MKIKVLPEHVANRIAAGEVVERPLGVVRELVDNAIDAGAKNLNIEVTRGGKELVRVGDDGSGMAPADARLAFERHATSKLQSAEDLTAISTLGFRGEALAAIASVSRIRLRTCEPASQLACEIVLSAGTLIEESECAAPAGTLVEVHDLFFNAPARQKFLRSDRSEELRIRAHLLQMTLAHPDVSFRYVSDQREIFKLPARSSMLERAHSLFRGSLVEFSENTKFGLSGEQHIRMHGLIGHPALAHSKVDSFVIIVNGRVIGDRTILRAVREGFESTLKPREFPVGVLAIDMPCEMVDVNVHPQKSEVRFSQSQALFLAIRSAVRRAVQKFSAPIAANEMMRSKVTEQGTAPQTLFGSSQQTQFSLQAGSHYYNNTEKLEDLQREVTRAVVTDGDFQFSRLRYRGQIFECYLVCEAADKLVLIDMHAAHERYNYNLIRNRFREAQVVSQPLLIPLEIELAPLALERCREHALALAQLGFEIEFSTEESLQLRAIPALLTEARDLAGLFRELALSDLDGAAAVEERLDAIAARIACHASIRSGKAMTNEEVEALFYALDSSAFSAACPHGRPVVVEFSVNEVERWFGRDR